MCEALDNPGAHRELLLANTQGLKFNDGMKFAVHIVSRLACEGEEIEARASPTLTGC